MKLGNVLAANASVKNVDQPQYLHQGQLHRKGHTCTHERDAFEQLKILSKGYVPTGPQAPSPMLVAKALAVGPGPGIHTAAL